MKYIVATPPPKLRDEKLYRFALVYAVLIVLCMLGQLFRFDHIISAVVDENMFGGQLGVVFWTVLAVVQLFALPFLLRLHMSQLMRLVSVIAALLVPLFWAGLLGWQLSVSSQTLGVFGTEVTQLNVWWVTGILIIVALVGASASVASIGSTMKQLRTALSK